MAHKTCKSGQVTPIAVLRTYWHCWNLCWHVHASKTINVKRIKRDGRKYWICIHAWAWYIPNLAWGLFIELQPSIGYCFLLNSSHPKDVEYFSFSICTLGLGLHNGFQGAGLGCVKLFLSGITAWYYLDSFPYCLGCLWKCLQVW